MSDKKSNPPVSVETYLFFDGRCEEAIEFYRQAVGAEVTMLMRFKDSPEPPQPGACAPGSEKKVMHGRIKIGSTILLVSDGRCGGKPNFQGFSLSIPAKDESEFDRYFNALAKDGQVQMPPAKTFFSPKFGMLTDRFGVMWMVLVATMNP